jgi:hypothetical protein
MLGFDAADELARSVGLEQADPEYFKTERRVAALREELARRAEACAKPAPGTCTTTVRPRDVDVDSAVLCCAVLCCAVLCCAVLCCAVLCCAVLCCAVLCCAVQPTSHTAP